MIRSANQPQKNYFNFAFLCLGGIVWSSLWNITKPLKRTFNAEKAAFRIEKAFVVGVVVFWKSKIVRKMCLFKSRISNNLQKSLFSGYMCKILTI